MGNSISAALTRAGVLTASPIAFLVVIAYAIVWAIFDRESLDVHGFATLATWMMTILIQRSEHRDTQAIHAKLDELLRVDQDASNDLTTVDNKEPEEIERGRDQAKARET